MALMRATIRALNEGRVLPCLMQSARQMTIELEKFKDKETAEEAVFFSKQDEKLLRGLLKKIKHQADAVDEKEAAEETACELTDLKKIVNKYSVSMEDMEALIRWKHGH